MRIFRNQAQWQVIIENYERVT